MVVAGMGITGVHVGKNMLVDFLSTMSASADVLALAKIEVDLDNIPEGMYIPIWPKVIFVSASILNIT